MHSPSSIFTLLMTSGVIALTAGCSTLQAQESATPSQEVASAAQDEPKSVNINLPANALFSVIGFDYMRTDEAMQARAVFQSSAIPIAVENGFTRHGALLVDGPSFGTFKPQGFLLTSWPSQEAFNRFENDPRWPEYSELRRSIWNDIRYYRDVQAEGLSLTLRSDKFYTLAIAYTDPDNAADYDEYLARLEGEVAKQGGKFILKLFDPNLESLSNSKSPDQLTFIEWDDAEGASRLLQSDTYKAVRHLAGSGTTDLSFYRLRPSL
ncbi:DUF1330 domain-containing protein [Altererythrobacter luteolus]|uniref:DUF1330 domain-containing protein n=1 Tax=Pontixanthobacter luteolus TaxID=295089 RepID=A0A6I4UWE2_9SPHN|nr:DUF1330 domain-containing protein [Pontixanthobacter luteolus]MXP46038.1 DUF1330 domain-containing protein [Pontixanthobacter luteolus]